MTVNRPPEEKLRECARLREKLSSNGEVAKMLNVNEATVRRWLKWHKELELDNPDSLVVPEFPPEDIGIEKIIDMACERFEVRAKSYAAHTWFKIGVKDKKPIGVLWFGDPHLDDNGCNWPQLRRHVELCKTTEGLYGANIGDTTNNWAGRLVRLYANQDTSVKTARRLAEWFMVDAGVRWLVWLIGNHDAWGDGADILARMGKVHGTRKVITHDWEARFCLEFPNGWTPKIYAAHNFPGHSQWNPLHGPMKQGQMGVEADLYVCGHLHNAAYLTFPNAVRDRVQHFLRLRGYKALDEHTRHLGITEQDTDGGAVTVFDPARQRIRVFTDPEEGADFLTYLRAKS